MRTKTSVAIFAFLILCGSAFADGQHGAVSDDDLKARVEALEKRQGDNLVVDERGHKYHPIHSIYGLKISGGVTLTGQMPSRGKTGNQRAGVALSADLALESGVGDSGRVVLVLDFQRGTLAQGMPTFFTAPNGNTTGPNADIESFNDNNAHLTQAYYEHEFSKPLAASIGQLDITGYFDANKFANNERTQFLANLFVNNPAVEFGGSPNFYGPGLRLSIAPAGFIDLTAGAFEGDGDWVNSFDAPFLMAEADVKAKPAGMEGNYRFYYWRLSGRGAANLPNTANPSDASLEKAANEGVGMSIDQKLNDNVGVWLRMGKQRHRVSRFDRHASAGLHLSGAIVGRSEDAAGIAYGITSMGRTYRGYLKSSNPQFNAGHEHYFELYYNIAIGSATGNTGFHITPDIQYVMNPGGDTAASKEVIYGIRLQTFF
ncbi:MAG: carbohydrate porin [Deltaproteobacteria bacterium]